MNEGFNLEKFNDDELNNIESPIESTEKLPINTNQAVPVLDSEGYRSVALNRVVGLDTAPFTDENSDLGKRDSMDAFDHFKEGLVSNEVRLGTVEIEKTMEQKEICEMILHELPEFLKEYGLEHPVRIPSTAIRILNMATLGDKERVVAKKFPGEWHMTTQRIELNGDFLAECTKIKFAKILIHEMIHAQSFGSIHVRFNEDRTSFSFEQRKGGLVSYTETKDSEGNPVLDDNFAQLDEAVTELLARRFFKSNIDKIPHITSDVKEIKNEMEQVYSQKKIEKPELSFRLVDVDTGIEYGDENPDHYIKKESPFYSKQVNMLLATLKKVRVTCNNLPENDPRKEKYSFPDDESVLKIITKSYFSGQQLEFARLLKTVYPNMKYSHIGHSTRIHGSRRDNSENKKS